MRIIIWFLLCAIAGGAIGSLCAEHLGPSFWSLAAAVAISAMAGFTINVLFPPVRIT